MGFERCGQLCGASTLRAAIDKALADAEGESCSDLCRGLVFICVSCVLCDRLQLPGDGALRAAADGALAGAAVGAVQHAPSLLLAHCAQTCRGQVGGAAGAGGRRAQLTPCRAQTARAGPTGDVYSFERSG